MKELRDVYVIPMIAKTNSINLDNVEVILKSVTMENEDGDKIEFSNRFYDVGKERCSDGVKIMLYIVNDGTEISDRMDYLVDEEYVITAIDATVTTKSTGEVLEYTFEEVGNQEKKEIDIVVDPQLEKAANYLIERLTEGNQCIKDVLIDALRNDEELQYIANQIMDISFI